jgi:hypothetical protein
MKVTPSSTTLSMSLGFLKEMTPRPFDVSITRLPKIHCRIPGERDGTNKARSQTGVKCDSIHQKFANIREKQADPKWNPSRQSHKSVP